jgi:hypothetical protein
MDYLRGAATSVTHLFKGARATAEPRSPNDKGPQAAAPRIPQESLYQTYVGQQVFTFRSRDQVAVNIV